MASCGRQCGAYGWQRGQVARQIAHGVDQVADRLLAFRHAVEVAHAANRILTDPIRKIRLVRRHAVPAEKHLRPDIAPGRLPDGRLKVIPAAAAADERRRRCDRPIRRLHFAQRVVPSFFTELVGKVAHLLARADAHAIERD